MVDKPEKYFSPHSQTMRIVTSDVLDLSDDAPIMPVTYEDALAYVHRSEGVVTREAVVNCSARCSDINMLMALDKLRQTTNPAPQPDYGWAVVLILFGVFFIAWLIMYLGHFSF